MRSTAERMNKKLLTALTERKIDVTYEIDEVWMKKIGFSDRFKTINIKFKKRVLHINWDRYGFVCDELDLDQVSFEVVFETIIYVFVGFIKMK